MLEHVATSVAVDVAIGVLGLLVRGRFVTASMAVVGFFVWLVRRRELRKCENAKFGNSVRDRAGDAFAAPPWPRGAADFIGGPPYWPGARKRLGIACEGAYIAEASPDPEIPTPTPRDDEIAAVNRAFRTIQPAPGVRLER